MITTKRQVRTERDKFGGYAEPAVDTDIIGASTPVDILSVRNTSSPNMSIVADPEPTSDIMPTVKPSEPAPLYTPFASATKPAPTFAPAYTDDVAVAPEKIPPRPEKTREPLEKEDLMPSLHTRAMASRAESADISAMEKSETERRSHSALSPKVKMMLFIYIAVALVLAIAVIATGVSISKSSAAADSLAQEIASKQAVIAEQEAEIANLTNEATIRDEAIKNGMEVAGDSAYTSQRVDKVEYPEAQEHTNGFDKFADGVSDFIN